MVVAITWTQRPSLACKIKMTHWKDFYTWRPCKTTRTY